MQTLASDKQQPVLLLYVDINKSPQSVAVEEFAELAVAANADIRDTICVKRYRPDAKYFIGCGQVEELAEKLQQSDIQLILVNRNMSPSQERNIEQICKARVLGYSGLILDIFSRRARSHEGKLQVELAQLDYLSTRLVRGWSHLERQKGGIGLRGPGEKQLETDRRLLKKRIALIKRRLDKVKCQHNLSRRMREKNRMLTIALVGYTNVGKSTLFNRLTSNNTYVADKLFATLDTLMRKVYLPGIGNIIISDTVGFIRNLPYNLIEAFNATLHEVCTADLLLHVVDDAHQDNSEQRMQVDEILETIGAGKVPRLLVFNKADRSGRRAEIIGGEDGSPKAVRLSAATGDGIELLKYTLADYVREIDASQAINRNGNQSAERILLHSAT